MNYIFLITESIFKTFSVLSEGDGYIFVQIYFSRIEPNIKGWVAIVNEGDMLSFHNQFWCAFWQNIDM